MPHHFGAASQVRLDCTCPGVQACLVGEAGAALGGGAHSSSGERLGKPPVMAVGNENLDSVMESVTPTSLQAALLRIPDSI